MASASLTFTTLACVAGFAITELYFANMGWVVSPFLYIATQQRSNSFLFKMIAFFLLVFQVQSAWLEKTFASHCAFAIHVGMLLTTSISSCMGAPAAKSTSASSTACELNPTRHMKVNPARPGGSSLGGPIEFGGTRTVSSPCEEGDGFFRGKSDSSQATIGYRGIKTEVTKEQLLKTKEEESRKKQELLQWEMVEKQRADALRKQEKEKALQCEEERVRLERAEARRREDEQLRAERFEARWREEEVARKQWRQQAEAEQQARQKREADQRRQQQQAHSADMQRRFVHAMQEAAGERNQPCIDLTKEDADVSVYGELVVSGLDKQESDASRRIKRLQLSPRSSFASSSSFGRCVSSSVGVSSSRRESDDCSDVSSVDSCSGRSNRSGCSSGSRASSEWDLFRSAHAGQYSRDEMSRAYQAYKQSAASVTPVTPVRVQASTAGTTFYKGGQYTPGGGRAPRGGAWC